MWRQCGIGAVLTPGISDFGPLPMLGLLDDCTAGEDLCAVAWDTGITIDGAAGAAQRGPETDGGLCRKAYFCCFVIDGLASLAH